MSRYEPCVLGADGRCTRWSHTHGEAVEIATADGHACIGGDCPGCVAALARAGLCPNAGPPPPKPDPEEPA